MNHSASTAALIPAAGTGSRLGRGPKALLRLGDRTLLAILLDTLATLVDEVVVAFPADYADRFAQECGQRARLIPGGKTRQESVKCLVAATSADLLLIQDAARPFPSRRLCAEVLAAARAHGAAGAFLDPAVPVGLNDGGWVADYRDRTQAGIFQAPQAFQRSLLESAQASAGDLEYQSTAQMVMRSGSPLFAVAGEASNIKITTALDWEIARRVIGPELGLA